MMWVENKQIVTAVRLDFEGRELIWRETRP
jgi:hypothetical protein